MSELMSAEGFAELLVSHRWANEGRYEAVEAAYAAALARVAAAEASDEESTRLLFHAADERDQWHRRYALKHDLYESIVTVICEEWFVAFAKLTSERDALAAELSELRAAVTEWRESTDACDNSNGLSLMTAIRRQGDAYDALRTIAAQPQGERGKALLAVVEATREWLHNPSFDVDEVLESNLRAALAAIDGAQPGA